MKLENKDIISILNVDSHAILPMSFLDDNLFFTNIVRSLYGYNTRNKY